MDDDIASTLKDCSVLNSVLTPSNRLYAVNVLCRLVLKVKRGTLKCALLG